MPEYKVPKGQFWADYIKTLKDDPESRLHIAREHMPLPAAFRHAAIALRGLIRKQKREGKDTSAALRDLYETVAQESFLLATDYIDGIGPGFNVAERIPRAVWEALDYPYEEIGFRELRLVNKTDAKWFVDAWGEPARHVSAQVFHQTIWNRAVEETSAKTRRREEDLIRLLQDDHAPHPPLSTERDVAMVKTGCGVLLLFVCGSLVGATAWALVP